MLGIEINTYAAELARTTVWIGEIQWMLKNGYEIKRKPILSPLDHIECRDAVLTPEGKEPTWPKVDCIVGNPPFLGDKKMRKELGNAYVDKLRDLYEGRVPGGADLVTYWFEKARTQLNEESCSRVGLVATDSIRGGASRRVLDRITETSRIYEAWSSEDWINDGAAVRVSLVCYGLPNGAVRLDGTNVPSINADLTPGGDDADLTKALALRENARTAFQGITKGGSFEIPGATARAWLKLPNPNGRSNTEVLRPWKNGLDVTRRDRDMWIIDFNEMDEKTAAQFEKPFEYVRQHVKPERDAVSRPRRRRLWWQYNEVAPGMRAAIASLSRFIVTLETGKHRSFAWLSPPIVPDKNLVVIARSDDVTFGIVQSRFHLLWSLGTGTALEDRPRYTSTTTFETYPFPEGLTPANTKAGVPASPAAAEIANAAKRLNELRENWRNPSEWVERIPEVLPGYPDRIVAKSGSEALLLKRKLTSLYNENPSWLQHAHQAIDEAVAKAYGWNDYTPEMPDNEIRRRLLALNFERAKQQEKT